MNSTGLKVIALISGGKDSLFSILHCRQNGHQVVALANLYPSAPQHPHQESAADVQDFDELDSHFYQTIGHQVVPLYAEALGLPLYRDPIRGTNVDAAKVYHVVRSSSSEHCPPTDHDDEIESLIPLLKRIQAEHPSANAITTGAILSDYQRTRVESVALRLSLTPLAFLWQFPRLPPHTQTSLLEDMRAAGQESRLIKVSSGGLGGDHLWLSLSEAKTINRLTKDFGRLSFLPGNVLETGCVLGEGGEYETLCLSGPRCLWKKRIVVDDNERQSVKGDAGSWSLRIVAARCADFNGQETDGHGVRVPDLYDAKFAAIEQRLRTDELVQQKRLRISELEASPLSRSTPTQQHRSSADLSNLIAWHIKDTGPELFVSNMLSECEADDTTAQIKDIMTRMSNVLKGYELQTSQISLTVILLRDMSDFVLVNSIYSDYFDKPSPPARVTVACGEELPAGKQIMLSAWIRRLPREDREGLHVQSRSYWAPANIGPYSQAISVPLANQQSIRSIVVAGQIPLRPASMEIVSHDFTEQALLSLQHLWRVGQAMRVHWWHGGAIAFVSTASSDVARERAIIVERCWRLAHVPDGLNHGEDDEPAEDIADQSLYRSWANPNTSISLKTPLWPLPCRITSGDDSDLHMSAITPCFTIHVEALPRAAQIEWWSYGLEFQAEARSDLDVKYHVVKKDTQLDRLTGDSLAGVKGLVEIFVTNTTPQDVLSVAHELQAMIIPCKGIFTAHEHEIVALIRHR